MLSPFRNRHRLLCRRIRRHHASAFETVITAFSSYSHDARFDIVQAKGKRTEPDGGEGGGAAKKLRTDEGSASVTLEGHDSAPPEVTQQSPASVRLTVCRDGAVLLARVALATEDGLGTDCLVHFCGAQVQVSAYLS